MKLHDITALTVKISGLVLFVIVLSKIPEYINSYLSYESSLNPVSYLYYILPLLIVGIACLVLLFLPYTISNHLFFESATPSSSTDMTNVIQVIAIRLLGFLLLFWSVSDLIFNLFVLLIYRDLIEPSYAAGTFDFPALFATIAEILFAFVMLKNANKISLYLNTAGK